MQKVEGQLHLEIGPMQKVYETRASGIDAHAQGKLAHAEGEISHAEGYKTVASGKFSHAEGYETRAEGEASHAEGYKTVAQGVRSFAMGVSTKAIGWQSSALGVRSTSDSYNSLVIGKDNKPLKSTSTVGGSFNINDDIFVIGNGTSAEAQSNAFRVTNDGKTYGLSAFNSTGADYAEYFEWLDGNPDDEDRIALIVTLDGDKIRLANEGDTFILGAISGNPSVVGNNYADDWQGKYEVDRYGRPLTEEVTVIEKDIDENGDEIDIEVQQTVFKLNSSWNSNEVYVPRSERKEWDTVGMLGRLYLMDDGTCQVDEYVKPSINGIGTHSNDITKLRVINRIDESLIEVLII